MSFKEIKEAFVKTCKEKPETATKILWASGVTIFMVGSYIYMRDLDKRIVQVARFTSAHRINEEQHFCNLLGQIEYICEKSGLDKAAMAEAGSTAARANWNRLGFTDKTAELLVKNLEAGPGRLDLHLV